MELTIYEKNLVKNVVDRYAGMSAGELTEMLIRIGVVDTTLCKVLTVRAYVDETVARGSGKVDAMFAAAEKFCCSYEYVRKCMYYYKGVGFDAVAGRFPHSSTPRSGNAKNEKTNENR